MLFYLEAVKMNTVLIRHVSWACPCLGKRYKVNESSYFLLSSHYECKFLLQNR